jgi:hypothetical protein
MDRMERQASGQHLMREVQIVCAPSDGKRSVLPIPQVGTPCAVPFLSTARHSSEQRPSDQDDTGGLQLWQGILHPRREQRNPGHNHGSREAVEGRARSCGEADQIREEPAAGGAAVVFPPSVPWNGPVPRVLGKGAASCHIAAASLQRPRTGDGCGISEFYGEKQSLAGKNLDSQRGKHSWKSGEGGCVERGGGGEIGGMRSTAIAGAQDVYVGTVPVSDGHAHCGGTPHPPSPSSPACTTPLPTNLQSSCCAEHPLIVLVHPQPPHHTPPMPCCAAHPLQKEPARR